METNWLVPVVGQLEGHRLLLANYTVSNGELVLWQPLESHTLRVALASDIDLVLLIRVAQRAEGQLEALTLSLLGSELDIERVVRFWSDCVAQVSQESEAVVMESVEPRSGGDLSLVL